MNRTLPTPWKPTKAQLLAAHDKLVPDLVAKDLIVLFAGINPGLYTAAIGRHFGRPGNRFWPALHDGGFTPRLFSPFEGSLLLDLKFGITNIVDRATARADELTDDELRAGGQRLEAKVKRWRPTVVAFVGIGPYRIVSGIKDARVGLQKAPFGGSHAWVLPNPSGLNAHYQPAALAQLFGDLRLWAIAQHGPPLKGRHGSSSRSGVQEEANREFGGRGPYTSPAGDFSTLTKTSSGYTRTLSDGTQITFNSSGYENATIDLNGLHTTYSYNGSNQLPSIEDPYGNLTTFTYSSGYLSTIQDPAGRLTTFTMSGSKLEAVEQADGSFVTYTYDGSGRMTEYQDQRAKRNDRRVRQCRHASARSRCRTARSQLISSVPGARLDQQRDLGQPGVGDPAGRAATSYTDPNGNTFQIQPDWYGPGPGRTRRSTPTATSPPTTSTPTACRTSPSMP